MKYRMTVREVIEELQKLVFQDAEIEICNGYGDDIGGLCINYYSSECCYKFE